MTVNERLFAAGLLDAFDRAAARHDSTELARILKEVSLSEPDIQGVLEWVAHSPYSEFNREPIVLDSELVVDRRVVALGPREQRIVQHLFQKYGGPSGASCARSGCEQRALVNLAYCAFCAHSFAHAY
jgi:hypothetical protein